MLPDEPHQLKDSANISSSVLIVSIVRLKSTIDMMDDPDLTWKSTMTGVWWQVQYQSPPASATDSKYL